MRWVSPLVRLYAALLGVAGLALLFAPDLLVPAVPDASQALVLAQLVLAQLVGAALLGFAAAGWTARGSILGGIYGRAVVAGNQAFAFVGALVLFRALLSEPSPALWVLFGTLAFGAVLYSVLMFRPPRLEGKEDAS